jgi:hypothetical protein
LEHHVCGAELKNFIERMNQYLKDRLENFDDYFPCLKERCDKEHVHNWISVLRFYHNYARVNEEIARAPLAYDDGPKYQRFIEMLREVTLT